MGHLINPISTRLAFSSFWLSSWTDYSLNYFSYNLMLDSGLKVFLDWMFVHSWFAQLLTKSGIFLSHYRFLRRGNNFRVNIFLVYNSSLVLKSSFVETAINSLPTDWSTVWFKKNLQLKLKNRNFKTFLKLSKSLETNKNNFNSSNLLNLFIFLEKLLNSQKGETLDVQNFSKRSSLAKNSRSSLASSKNFSILKKIIISKALENLNVFFSEILSSTFSHFLTISEKKKTKIISFSVKFLDNFNLINPQFLARFIARRVSYGFQLQRVLKPLIRDLVTLMSKKKNKIIGFRIACSGRFDRKQIASYIWQKFGPVSLNKFSANVNYGVSTAYLKYGTCGIKVWVASKHNPIVSQFKSRNEFINFTSKVNLLKKSNLDFFFTNSNLIKSIVTVFVLFGLFIELSNKELNFNKFNSFLLPKSYFTKFYTFNYFLKCYLLLGSWVKYENKMLLALK